MATIPLTKSCCEGTLHTAAQPTGTEIKIGVYDVYEALPTTATAPASVVVIAPDIFGWALPNVRLIADNYAKAGIRALVPNILKNNLPADLFEKAAEAESPDCPPERKEELAKYRADTMGAFFASNSIEGGVEHMKVLIRHLRDQGVQKVAMPGYCWGGGICVKLGAESGFVDLVCPIHPSRLSLPDDIKALKVPACFLLAEKDTITKELADDILKVLQQKGLPFFHKYYLGCKHGWAVRGDEDNPDVVAKRQDAFDCSLSFVRANLGFQ
ncbi:hypothetical protein HDV03_001621 [Kappamyces sp. JEL0829]|nr:hypothetical protein HDV03_001621 [Kappamyces sp. JEL0829]